jgi:hypothetical protein
MGVKSPEQQPEHADRAVYRSELDTETDSSDSDTDSDSDSDSL